MLAPWKESYVQPRQHIKEQRHYFANKGLSSQGYGFSSSHVWMWELDYKESWALKNWCFWEKNLDSPLDCKEIQPVHPKRDQSWVHWKEWCWSWNSNTLVTCCRELTHWKRPWCWERLRAGEKGMTEVEMVGWHHQHYGHGFGWTPGVSDGQGGLACCSSWGLQRVRHDWVPELNWIYTQKLTVV